MTEKRPIEPLTEEEAAALLCAASPRSASGARARALVALGVYSGLRVAELLALRPHDVDLEAHSVSVLRGKGNRRRVAALRPEGVVHVERWLRRRAELGIKGGPLLCTLSRGANVLAGDMRPGAPLSRSYVAALLVRLAKRAGIAKRVHPHGLRHSHAHMLAGRGKLVTDVQRQLGHSNLSTTSRYLEDVAPAGRIARLCE